MSKAKKKRLPIRKVENKGGSTSYQVDKGWVNGKRERPTYKTHAEALVAAEQLFIERQDEGLRVFGLSQDTKLDASRAHEILAPFDASLVDAANYYKKHFLAYRSAPLVKDIIDKMIAEKETKNRADVTIKDLKSRLQNTFVEDFGERRLSEISKDELEEWLNDEEWSPRSRINYHTKVSQLYNYAIRNEWIDTNITDRIDRPSAVDSEPEIFSVEEAGRLLLNANDFGLLPYIALGLFAGIRSAELMKLRGEHIVADEKSIIIPAEVAKKRTRRVVNMQDALLAWLKPCLPLKGKIVSASEFRHNMDMLRAAAKIETWRKNGLRHSFASYHLATHENEILTAKEMGHRDSNIVHKHYKQLILKSEAAKFWALRPPSTAPSDKIVQIQIAA